MSTGRLVAEQTRGENCVREVDHVAPNAKLSHQIALLHIFVEDNDAVLKMIIICLQWYQPLDLGHVEARVYHLLSATK